MVSKHAASQVLIKPYTFPDLSPNYSTGQLFDIILCFQIKSKPTRVIGTQAEAYNHCHWSEAPTTKTK